MTDSDGRYGASMEVAKGVHRLGSEYVNFYAIEDAGSVTIVDGGIASYYDQVPALLQELGRSMSDVAAIVQTHVHSDHIGITERLRAATGAPVFVHEIEGPVLTGDQKLKGPKGVGRVLLAPSSYRMIAHILTKGGTKYPTVESVRTFADGEELDVPGGLLVLFTPGHSDGHCSLVCEARDAVFAGDAIVTRDLKGQRGPRLMDLNADVDRARASLDRFAEMRANTLLPGHGDPWHGSPADAAAQARRA